MDVTRWCSI